MDDVIQHANRFSKQEKSLNQHTVLNIPIPVDLAELDMVTSLIENNRHNIVHMKFSQSLIDAAYNLLTKHQYHVVKVDAENYNENATIEYHVYVSDKKDAVIKSEFSEHCDNFGGVHFAVHTCIFYIENTFERGGDLVVYFEKKEPNGDYIIRRETLDTRKMTVLLISGDKYHEITPAIGQGCRRCVVIQLKDPEFHKPKIKE